MVHLALRKGTAMGSNVKQVRQAQRETFLRKLAQRKAALAEQGVTPDKIKKDRMVKHLLSDIQRTALAIASIEKRAKTIEQAQQQKQERAAQAAAAPKGKKGKAEAPPVKEGKKEKKEKKDKKEKKEAEA